MQMYDSVVKTFLSWRPCLITWPHFSLINQWCTGLCARCTVLLFGWRVHVWISRFGTCIGKRKYLHEYTPFGSVKAYETMLTLFQGYSFKNLDGSTISGISLKKFLCLAVLPGEPAKWNDTMTECTRKYTLVSQGSWPSSASYYNFSSMSVH